MLEVTQRASGIGWMQTQASPFQLPPLIHCVPGARQQCTHIPHQAPSVIPNITAHGSRPSLASWRRPQITAGGPRPSPVSTQPPPKLAANHRPQVSAGEGRQHPCPLPRPWVLFPPSSGPGILVPKALLSYFPSSHNPRHTVHENKSRIHSVHR